MIFKVPLNTNHSVILWIPPVVFLYSHHTETELPSLIRMMFKSVHRIPAITWLGKKKMKGVGRQREMWKNHIASNIRIEMLSSSIKILPSFPTVNRQRLTTKIRYWESDGLQNCPVSPAAISESFSKLSGLPEPHLNQRHFTWKECQKSYDYFGCEYLGNNFKNIFKSQLCNW